VNGARATGQQNIKRQGNRQELQEEGSPKIPQQNPRKSSYKNATGKARSQIKRNEMTSEM